MDKYVKKKKDVKVTCFTAKKCFLGKIRIPIEKLEECPYYDEWVPLMDKNNKSSPKIVGDLHVKVTYTVPGQPTPRASMKSKNARPIAKNTAEERSELLETEKEKKGMSTEKKDEKVTAKEAIGSDIPPAASFAPEVDEIAAM